MATKRCAVRDCPISRKWLDARKEMGLIGSMLKFPDDKFNEWKEIIDEPNLTTENKICEFHFEDECFKSTRGRTIFRFTHKARPTIFGLDEAEILQISKRRRSIPVFMVETSQIDPSGSVSDESTNNSQHYENTTAECVLPEPDQPNDFNPVQYIKSEPEFDIQLETVNTDSEGADVSPEQEQMLLKIKQLETERQQLQDEKDFLINTLGRIVTPNQLNILLGYQAAEDTEWTTNEIKFGVRVYSLGKTVVNLVETELGIPLPTEQQLFN